MRPSHGAAAALLAALMLVEGCGGTERSSFTDIVDPVIAPGESLYARGEFDSARALWSASLAQPGVAGSVTEARLLTWIGLAAWRAGDYAEARQLGERALELKQRLGLEADIPQSQNALGLLAWDEGRLAEAASFLTEANAGFRTAGDRAGVAKTSSNLGLVLFELGRFDEARSAFATAVDTAGVLGDLRIQGRALSNLAMLEIWAGDPTAAVDMLHRARSLSDSANDAVGSENALGQLGVAYGILGEPGLALVALDSALEVARRGGLREQEANDLLAIASIYRDAGDPDQAIRAYAEARRINEELGLTIETGIVLRSEAAARAARGALDVARQNVTRALQLHRKADAKLEEFHDLLVLVEIESLGRRPAVAEQALREARTLAARLGSAQARLSHALAEARLADGAGDPRRSLRALAAARADLPRGGAAAEAEANALRMRALASLGQLDSAAVAGRLALNSIERVREGFASGPLRTSYVADRSRVYSDLVFTLLRLNRTDEAFATADAARGRAMLENLSAAKRGLRAGAGVRDLREAEQLLRRIDRLLAQLSEAEATPPHERGPAAVAVSDELARRLEEARSRYEALLLRTTERHPSLARLMGARPARPAEVRAALRQNEALLEYLVTRDRLFVFVLTREKTHVISQEVRRDELTHRVQLARELFQRVAAGRSDHPVGKALYELLLKPAKSGGQLHGITRLFIVPHGALTYLPFAALRDPMSDRVLTEEFSVSYLPNAATLTLLGRDRGAAPVPEGAATFAPFPDRLPSTLAEVQALRRTLSGVTTYTAARASEPMLRRALSQDRIVHVATHGIMNARNPMFSRLELARGRNGTADDGRLEVHELLDLRISSPLVFLSGCQTALGSAWTTAFDQGEDYATLAQAFLYAGAGSVVATLWRIDDAGAAAFAERFYHHLRAQPAADALAAAQRDMRADPRWRSPYYWAAYTVSGDGFRPLSQTAARVAVTR